MVKELPPHGFGFNRTEEHILREITPALNGSSLNPRYYGFVTGGITKSALVADIIASLYDQNVQVHLPEQTIATELEANALDLLKDLFNLDRKTWVSGTLTTGATASNILGLACGREYVLHAAAQRHGSKAWSVGEHGLLETLKGAGISTLQVLSTRPHSSLTRSAGIVGIGRSCVKAVHHERDTMRFDLDRLAKELANEGAVSIVAVSCGEVNTGHFATSSLEEFRRIREICDQHQAWIHVDGAFGVFGRVLNGDEFEYIRGGCEGLELADSITGDCHKLINVPYDSGFFFCRHKSLAAQVFQNGNAAYLSSGTQASISSPLNIGIENSRRFRALPVYATLLEYGPEGYATMLKEQIRLARDIADWLFDHEAYDVLPTAHSLQQQIERTFMIVLFRARDKSINTALVGRINDTSKMYVSGTVWEGEPGCRIAISNWRADRHRDFSMVRRVLEEAVEGPK